MNEHIKNVCKIGQGNDCCRYVTVGAQGFECAKHTGIGRHIDLRVENESIVARGSNCDGKTIEELNTD